MGQAVIRAEKFKKAFMLFERCHGVYNSQTYLTDQVLKAAGARKFEYKYFIIIGERSEPPLSVELSEFSLYLYIYIYILIYIFQPVSRARAVNALRANVGPAG